MNELDIRDIQPPVNYPIAWMPWLIALLIVVLGVILFYLWKRFHHSKARVPIKPVRPSWEIAREALMKLREKNYPAQNLIKAYYIELSDILRFYIEARFGIDAPEMTTEEFLESLRFSSSLNDVQKRQLQKFLISCDMVKFAKYGATMTEMDLSFNMVEKFIQETMITREIS